MNKTEDKKWSAYNQSLVYFKVYTYTHYIEQVVEHMIVEEEQYIL